MLAIVLTFHTLVSILLIVVVLLQAGRGAELGAAFGGIGQATAAKTPTTALTKVTAVLATLFMLSSLWLAFWYQTLPNSVVQPVQTKPSARAETPTTPNPPASVPAQPTKP